MSEFRFQDFEIWKKAGEIALKLFDVADQFEARGRRRFAEQLRAASLSMPNNIAEGAGSYSKDEFKHFLNVARRSVFECASMLLVFAQNGLVAEGMKAQLLGELEELSKKISSFRKSLD